MHYEIGTPGIYCKIMGGNHIKEHGIAIFYSKAFFRHIHFINKKGVLLTYD